MSNAKQPPSKINQTLFFIAAIAVLIMVIAHQKKSREAQLANSTYEPISKETSDKINERMRRPKIVSPFKPTPTPR